MRTFSANGKSIKRSKILHHFASLSPLSQQKNFKRGDPTPRTAVKNGDESTLPSTTKIWLHPWITPFEISQHSPYIALKLAFMMKLLSSSLNF